MCFGGRRTRFVENLDGGDKGKGGLKNNAQNLRRRIYVYFVCECMHGCMHTKRVCLVLKEARRWHQILWGTGVTGGY